MINIILKNFNFCSSKYVIYNDTNFKKIIRKDKKTKLIKIGKTNNQIQSILSLKNIIDTNQPMIILNSDVIINIKKKDVLKTNKQIIYFTVSKNLNYKFKNKVKDTVKLDRKNKILNLTPKNNNIKKDDTIYSGCIFFKRWEFFYKNAVKKKYLQKKICFSKLIKDSLKDYSFFAKEVDLFIDLEDKKDFEEYKFWKNYYLKNFYLKDSKNDFNIQTIIPSAGSGTRHKKLGYNLPKPLIPISGKKMYERSYESLPEGKIHLIFHKKIKDKFDLKSRKKNILIHTVNKKTKGMAITIDKIKSKIDLTKPTLVSSCDIKIVINYNKFYKLIKEQNPEGIIFTWKNYPFADESPNSHAYILHKKNKVTKISEKIPVSNNPNLDSAVTGIFYFKNAALMFDCIDYIKNNKITVNNEYYIATSMIKLLKDKKNIQNFEVDQFISWSLPEHFKDYNYWQDIFKLKN